MDLARRVKPRPSPNFVKRGNPMEYQSECKFTERQICFAKGHAELKAEMALGSNLKFTQDFENKTFEGKVMSQFIGILAEIAFAIMFSKRVYIGMDLEAKPDFIHEKYSIDVKGTPHKNGRLIAHYKKTAPEKYDIYVLIRIALPFATFGGWEWDKYFIKPDMVGDLGFGKTYIVPNIRLKNYHDFLRLGEKIG